MIWIAEVYWLQDTIYKQKDLQNCFCIQTVTLWILLIPEVQPTKSACLYTLVNPYLFTKHIKLPLAKPVPPFSFAKLSRGKSTAPFGSFRVRIWEPPGVPPWLKLLLPNRFPSGSSGKALEGLALISFYQWGARWEPASFIRARTLGVRTEGPRWLGPQLGLTREKQEQEEVTVRETPLDPSAKVS